MLADDNTIRWRYLAEQRERERGGIRSTKYYSLMKGYMVMAQALEKWQVF
jgi:hypothetical protein